MTNRTFVYLKTAAPSASNDSSQGYYIGDEWLDTTNDRIYKAIDVTVSAAVWSELGTPSSVSNLQAGWNTDGSTWTYSSADGSTGVVSINADKTGTFQKGMRIKYNQSQALTAYWSFDTNSNSDVGAFNGTDTAMTYTAGKFSNAATFNGTTSKIVLTDTASLKPTGETTLGLWFKTSNTGAVKTLFQTFSADTAFAGISFRITSGNVLELIVGKNTGTTINIDYSDFTGTTTVTDNAYHYVVVTIRNNYAQMYLDGVLESYGYCVTPAYAATNYVRVGCGNATGTDFAFMNGQIDDLFLINGYALDEKTIRDKYAALTAQGTSSLTLTKCGIITNVGAYSGSATLVTFWGGNDFSLANATISSPYYSNMKVPFGFNPSPDKWTALWISQADITQANPISSAPYNFVTISCPIGEWIAELKARLYLAITHAAVTVQSLRMGLDLASAVFDTTAQSASNLVSYSTPIVTGGNFGFIASCSRKINTASKINIYVNANQSNGAGTTGISLALLGTNYATQIRLLCAYL